MLGDLLGLACSGKRLSRYLDQLAVGLTRLDKRLCNAGSLTEQTRLGKYLNKPALNS